MTQPCDLSAVEARRLIGLSKLSPLELFDSCTQRISDHNPQLNALVALDLDRARDLARGACEAVSQGRALGVLHGLPVAVKDLEATAGLTTTYGSRLFKDNVPEQDELHIQRIRAAGGIIIGKTNTPEFGAGSNTTNLVYGATGNPFASDKTCGGSSGGSAVALATGMASLATGSDYGGSLRTPAAFCGVVGFRPSPGVVPGPARGALFTSLSVLGPMGRCVADVRLLLGAQMGASPLDPFAACGLKSVPPDGMPADLSTLRVGFSDDLGCAPMDRDIARVFKEKTSLFHNAFRSHEHRHPPLGPLADEVFETLRGMNFVALHADKFDKHRELLGTNVIDNFERGIRLSARDIGSALAEQSLLFQRFALMFEEIDVLICPTAAVTPFPHTFAQPQAINGVPLATYMSWYSITYLLSLALPAVVSLPCGLDHQGMPFGIQVVGPMGSDAQVLAIALALESELTRNPQTRRAVPSWIE